MKKIEIMAPAGNFTTLSTAINAKAESVYFGVGNLNMRSRAVNFKEEDLEKIIEICKKNKVKSYLTLNTIIYDEELNQAKKLIQRAKKAGITAIIASDIAIIKYCKENNVEVHLSTQCNVTNIESVEFYSQFCDVIVLARELNLNQIKHICDKIKEKDIRGPNNKRIKIELFVHGALCVAISGKCYMSLAQYNESANRGKCLQACRREYKVKDNETGDELIIDNKFVMSPSDLCTIEILDKLIESGVEILKIEGRGRSTEYVDVVVKSYKKAIKLIENKKFDEKNKKKLISDLKKVFNRGFWHGGYYLGEKTGEWSNVYGSKTKEKKQTLGIIENYFSKNKVAQIKIETNELNLNDKIIITGPTTGIVSFLVKEMYVNGKKSKYAKIGDDLTLKTNKKVRKNDSVFVVT